jgi:predicted outer membrane repeat protein
MYGKMTAASIAAIGVMAAAGAGPAQAAAFVRVSCGSAALAAAVTSAASGTTLSLAPGCDYVLTAALPTITGDLTIDGHGATVERSDAPGTPAFTILTVDGDGADEITAIINRVDFRNGNGAISVTGLGTIAVTGGTFTANTAANGGAIDIDNTAYDSQVTGARFVGNTATTGSGGAIYDNSADSDINLDHSTFTGNHAAVDGGAFWDFGLGGELADSTFRGNTAASGGAIFTSENDGESLSGLVVHGNTATGDGGGIADDGAVIQDSTITGNHAGGNGGGIEQETGTGTNFPLEVTGTAIRGNSAASGGGIYAETTGVTVTGGTITRNRATADGGGIDNIGAANNSSITGSTITDNRAGGAGGGFYTSSLPGSGVSTAFTSSTVSRNRAATHGGGIYDDGPDAATTLTTTPVTGNKPDNCEPTGTIAGCTG